MSHIQSQDIHKAACPDFGPEEMVTKSAAYCLAVAYLAYMRAVEQHDGLGIRVWGPILVKHQKTAGIEVHPERAIAEMVVVYTDHPTGKGVQ